MAATQATLFTLLYVSWGVITVVLVALLSYRATLLSDGSQVFSDAAQNKYMQEQSILARRSQLTGEIIVLSVMSGVLLLTCVGISI